MESFEWIEMVAFAAILFVLWDMRVCMRDIERQIQLLGSRIGRPEEKAGLQSIAVRPPSMS